MKFEFYTQTFDSRIFTLEDNIKIKLLNYYLGQQYKGEPQKENQITIALEQDMTGKDKNYKAFWPLIIKLNVDEAKQLQKKLGKIINNYNKKHQAYEEVQQSY